VVRFHFVIFLGPKINKFARERGRVREMEKYWEMGSVRWREKKKKKSKY
jgi:hypothetical protein